MPASNEARGDLESPCISVCTLDENDLCLGCLRTLSEIARWAQMSPSEKRDVLSRVEARREMSEMG